MGPDISKTFKRQIYYSHLIEKYETVCKKKLKHSDNEKNKKKKHLQEAPRDLCNFFPSNRASSIAINKNSNFRLKKKPKFKFKKKKTNLRNTKTRPAQ